MRAPERFVIDATNPTIVRTLREARRDAFLAGLIAMGFLWLLAVVL